MTEAAVTTPSTPSGANGLRLPALNAVTPTTRKNASTASLMNDHDRVEARALADADAQHRGDREHDEDGRQVERAALAGRAGERVGQREAEQRVEQVVEVLAPADRDGGDRHGVLEDQVPADDPRRELAERRVGVRVGAARDRDRRGQLREGERGERAGDAGEDEGQDDRRAGVADRLADDHEDAGADDRAEAERGQVEQADDALQLARPSPPCRGRARRCPSSRTGPCGASVLRGRWPWAVPLLTTG